ncbi:family 16 glycosylhydrolase, partial [Corynebacterium amycolatum]|uniref:family 16 glycosylhydrolase n=1 Tax=Corynebacterium amycolatum TaxID=43765 RepID=UPI003AFFE9F5
MHASTVPWNTHRSNDDHATDADSKNIGPVDLPGSYHTWTMDWSPSGFIFYVDGKEYSRRSTWQNQWVRPDGSH